MGISDFLNSKSTKAVIAEDQVVAAIRQAESTTTGEIRVCVEAHCKYMDALDRAHELFWELGMDQTEQRNGVLIYLALKDHQYAIYSDEAISQGQLSHLCIDAAKMLKNGLKDQNPTVALCDTIVYIGNALATVFPSDPGIERNELPDEIIFDL